MKSTFRKASIATAALAVVVLPVAVTQGPSQAPLKNPNVVALKQAAPSLDGSAWKLIMLGSRWLLVKGV